MFMNEDSVFVTAMLRLSLCLNLLEMQSLWLQNNSLNLNLRNQQYDGVILCYSTI